MYARVCSIDAHAANVAGFFGERSAKAPGGPRELAQVVETIKLCAALRNQQGPSTAAFLTRLPPAR